jgi:peptidoglycan L-alanyl-D-glutamate endopeptidase CwlK
MLPGPFKFGENSQRQFDTLHEDLQNIFFFAIKKIDFTILEGRRTIEQQKINFIKGVSHTMDSRHIPRFSDGEYRGHYNYMGDSCAADIFPYQVGINPWPISSDSIEIKQKKLYRFYFLQGVIYSTAHALGIEIRQGIDWDRDFDFFDQTFDDMGHIELVTVDIPKLIFV